MPRLFRVSLLLILVATPLAGCTGDGPGGASSPQNAAPGQHLLPDGLTPEPWGETS